MERKIDLSAFDKTEDKVEDTIQQRKIDLSAFDKDIKSEETPLLKEDSLASDVRDLAVSAAQGATMGFGDELLAGINALMAGDPSKFREFQQKYENEYEILKQRSPNLALIGELAGGIAVPGFGVAGGLARASTAGGKLMAAMVPAAAASGLTSIGTSKKYLDPENLKQSAMELGEEGLVGAGYGAAGGAVLGAAGKTLGSLGEWWKKKKLAEPSLRVPSIAEEMYEKEKMQIRDRMGKLVSEEPLDIGSTPGGVAASEIVKKQTNQATKELLKPLEMARKEYEDAINKYGTTLHEKTFYTQYDKFGKEMADQVDPHTLLRKTFFDDLLPITEKEMQSGLMGETKKEFHSIGVNDTPLATVVKKIYPSFYQKLKSGAPISTDELLHIRKDLLNNHEKIKANLNPEEITELYGRGYLQKTGEKEVHGLADTIDEIIDYINPEIKNTREKIKQVAQIPEQIINRNVDEAAQPGKLYQLEPEEALNKLERIFGKNVEVAEGSSQFGNKARAEVNSVLDQYRKSYDTASEEIKKQLMKPDDFAELVNKTADYSAAHYSLHPAEKGNYNITASMGDIIQGGTGRALGLTGKSIAGAQLGYLKTRDTLKDLAKKPVINLVTTPTYYAGKATGQAITFPARTASEALKKSSSPAMQKLGSYLEESLNNKSGAAVAAALNSLYQDSRVREELNLKPGDSITKVRDE